jgi:hypothetical protein
VEGGGELEMERRESEAGRRGGVGAVLQVEDAMAGRHVPPSLCHAQCCSAFLLWTPLTTPTAFACSV